MNMGMGAHNILVLYLSISNVTGTVCEYLDAFAKYSRYHIHYMDVRNDMEIPLPLEHFDGIILFYSIAYGFRYSGFSSPLARQIAAYSGAKMCIIQDEYDSVNKTLEALAGMKIDALVTVMRREEAQKVYGIEPLRRMRLLYELTGYLADEDLGKPCRPLEERPLVLGYRGRPARYYYGALGMEKAEIGLRMKAVCAERGIAADIEVSEEARIYGAAWPRFLQSCRAVLGVESGSSIFDFDGTLRPRIDHFLARNPGAPFSVVQELFLRDLEGKFTINTVSPRIFEAILNRTGLVLYEGEYAGVVRPWEHYIPLKKNFSNLDEVLAAVMDDALLQDMLDRAYADVALSGAYSYRKFIGRLDDCLAELMPEKPRAQVLSRLHGYCPVLPDGSLGDLHPLGTASSFAHFCLRAQEGGDHAALRARYRERNVCDVPTTFMKDSPRAGAEGGAQLFRSSSAADAVTEPEMVAGLRASVWN